MAKREDLALIKSARAGAVDAQLALGTRYLFGGNGLPRSLPTATHWLDRAASQQEPQAWMLIGKYIPLDVARDVVAPENLYSWYEKAFDAGVMQAGFVLGQMVLPDQAGTRPGVAGASAGAGLSPIVTNLSAADAVQKKALHALKAAAHAGIADAQWLLAQQRGYTGGSVAPPVFNDGHTMLASEQKRSLMAADTDGEWTIRAAQGGITEAQLSMADRAWDKGQMEDFLQHALPLARDRLKEVELALPGNQAIELMAMQLTVRQIWLVSRCGRALMRRPEASADEIQLMLELAAYADDRDAQLALGLWFARMEVDGQRMPNSPGSAQYKKAIRWLTAAAERGSSDARFGLSRIFVKSEFSQRNLADMHRHLEAAAQMGHMAAQIECGLMAWRGRRDDPNGDINAAYWLLKAATQGSERAAEVLAKCADKPVSADWAQQAMGQVTRELRQSFPHLVARVELAAHFGLSRAEALLIDIEKSDAGHCLIVDIRADYSRSRRRLILIDTAEDRQLLQKLTRVFENMDTSAEGGEGNYRQRLYRLRKAFPDVEV